MPEESNYSREAIERLGLDPDDLGYVGLHVELPPVYKMVIEPEWTYVSPKFDYVKGLDVDPHITLIYGLLFDAKKNQDLIDGVLEKWYQPNVVVFPEVEAFPGDDGHELYNAIVLTLGTNQFDLEQLKEANDQLRRLPHVNGFPVYKPHITIAYVKREFKETAVNRLREIEIRPFRTLDLDYGS